MRKTKRLLSLLLMLVAVCSLTLVMGIAANAANDRIKITIIAYDNKTYTRHTVGTDYADKADSGWQSEDYTVRPLSDFTNKNFGMVTEVAGAFAYPTGSVQVGNRVKFSNNSSTATLIYYVDGFDIGTGSGEGSNGSGNREIGSGKYSWNSTIVFHSNYPDGTDYQYTIKFKVNTYASTGTISNAAVNVSSTDCGFSIPDGYNAVDPIWNTNKDGTGSGYGPTSSKWFAFQKGATAHLYAQWTPQSSGGTPAETVKLTYKNGMETFAERQYLKGDSAAVISCDAEKPGYTFQGWSTNSAATTVECEAGDVFTINAATTLYAVWKEDGTSGGTPEEPSPAGDIEIEIRVYDDKTFTAYDYVAKDYVNKAESGWQSEMYEIRPLSNFTNAEFGVINKVVGTFAGYNSNVNVGSNVQFSNNISKTTLTYHVDGYTPDTGTETTPPDAGEEVKPGGNTLTVGDGNYPWNQTIVFHANFPGGTDDTHTVQYTVNSYGENVDICNWPLTVTYAFCDFDIPTGYIPAEATWNTAADGSGDSYAPDDWYAFRKNVETVHMYAQWEETEIDTPVETDVTLIYMNGEDKYDEKTYTKGETVTVIGCTAVNMSSTFLGWTTDPAAETVEYKAGETFEIDTATTLYAVWKSNTELKAITLTYNFKNGTNGTMSDKKYAEAGETATFTVTSLKPEYALHVMAGWADAADATEAQYKAYDTITTAEDKTIYAVWKADTNNNGVADEDETYPITWKNEDGTVLKVDDAVKFGSTPEYSGETPTKEGNAQFTYTFAGWNPEVVAVTGEATYTATYTATLNQYTVTWANWDGTVLETDENVDYDATPTFNGATPTKAATEQFTYTFKDWTPTVSAVTGNVTYKATYTETINKYTVIWADEDGTELEKDENVEYGTMPTFDGATPTKAATKQFTYTFADWDSEVVAVTGNVTYKATYTETVNKYTVTWVDENDRTLKTEEVEYGTMPDYGKAPTKEGNAQYTYTFAGWAPTVSAVTEATTYKATYTQTLNKYTVTWENWDGTVLETDENVDYGAEPSYNGETPTRPADAAATYTFSGWTPAPSTVTGNVTYTAEYTATQNVYTLTINYVGIPDETIQSYSNQVSSGASYSVKSPEYEGYTADKLTVEGTMPSNDLTITVTYTCAHSTDTFGICNVADCQHPADCRCSPDETKGVRSLTIYTEDGSGNLMANVPVVLMMNPNKTGNGNDIHQELHYGVTDDKGCLVIEDDGILNKVIMGSNLYVSVTPLRDENGNTTTHDWAWPTNVGKALRKVNPIANVEIVTDSDSHEYANIRARDGVGFTADITIFVKEYEEVEPPVPVEVQGIVNFIVQTPDGTPVNCTMDLKSSVETGERKVIGTAEIVNGSGRVVLDANTLKTETYVGASLDCDPAGGYKWALDETNSVRTIKEMKGAIEEKENGANRDIRITANSATEGFEVTFLCIVKSDGTTTEPETPVVQGIVNFVVKDKDGNIPETFTMCLNQRDNGKATVIGTVEIVDGVGVLTLTADQLAALPVGAVLDCDPIGDCDYTWTPIATGEIVRRLVIEKGEQFIKKGSNTQEDALIHAAITDGFEITFNCIVKEKVNAAAAEGQITFNVQTAESVNARARTLRAAEPVNCKMNLNMRYNGKATVIGTVEIVDGVGVLTLTADQLAALPVGAVLDCDPIEGYEWALGDVAIVRTITEMEGAIAQGNNINHDGKIVADTAVSGFALTFNCIVKAN